jgi:hypothetical protein
MQWFLDNWELVLLAAVTVGTNLIAIGYAVAKLTPSTTDDEWIAKIDEKFKAVISILPKRQ